MAMAQQAALLIAKSRKELGEEGLAVLFMLFSKLNFENHLLLNQSEIGLELGMLRQNVQRSIKRLIAIKVLLEGPKQGQLRTYQLNPEFGWKGSGTNHKKALEKQRKQRMKAANITGIVKTPDTEEDPK